MLESRSVSYLNIIVISVVIIGILSFLGYQQKWKIETYVQAIAPVIIAISIVFLVVDRILYEKPHFSIIRSKDSPFKISQHYERKGAAFIIQNDGLRDANSVSLINLILTKRFETQKITYPEMYLMDGNPQSPVEVKVGQSIIGLIPESDFPVKQTGWMRLTVYAAFGKKHIFLRFGYNSSHNYTSVAKIYSYWVYLLCETLFLLRNYRLNRGFEVSYIFNFDEEQNNIK